MNGRRKRETHLAEIARLSPVASLDPPHRHFRPRDLRKRRRLDARRLPVVSMKKGFVSNRGW
jgi:hypothetical protein